VTLVDTGGRLRRVLDYVAGYRWPMDTQRDMRILQDMWESGRAPWRTST
jgi:hypothetical protein